MAEEWMHLKESSNDGSTTDDTGNGWAGGGSKTSGGGGAGHGRGWARAGSGAGLSGAGAVVWHGGRASASSRDASWAATSWVWGRGSGHDHAAGDWEDGHLVGERLKVNMLAAGKLQKRYGMQAWTYLRLGHGNGGQGKDGNSRETHFDVCGFLLLLS